MDGITYTFGPACGIPELAGKMVEGGQITEMLIGGSKEIVVRFATRIAGKAVVAKIAGKPELEAIYAEQRAAKARKAEILNQMGWPLYREIQGRCIDAHEAYDRASEYGYPAREAAALTLAEEALTQARMEYPAAAAYALAESYRGAENYRKSAAGRAAMDVIERGEEPLAAIQAMHAAWAQAAEEMVQNA